MSDNTLASIVRGARESGEGVASSLGIGIKERLKEKLDPRQFLNQSGLMTALFPGLKAYSSKVGDKASRITPSSEPKSIGNAAIDTEILAKNMMVLPKIHQDVNLMRQNMAKLVKLGGGKALTKVDKDFFKAKERAEAYKNQSDSKTSPSPETPKKKPFDLLKVVALIGMVGVGLKLGLDYVGDKIKESILELVDDLPSALVKGIRDEIKNLFEFSDKVNVETVGKAAIDYMTDEGVDRLTNKTVMDKMNINMEKYLKGELEDEDIDEENPSGFSAPNEENEQESPAGRSKGGEILGNSEDITAARTSAETYLGRKMSDDEWRVLYNTTKAESAYDSRSYAMVMGSILNRARDGYVMHGPNKGKKYSSLQDPIVQVAMDPFQFEAVTGSEGNGFKPSSNFTRQATPKETQAINFASAKILQDVPKNQVNFTATNPDAYKGAGHNIGYLKEMQKTGGDVFAGSQFNSKLGGNWATAPAAVPPAANQSGEAVATSSQTLKDTKKEANSNQVVVVEGGSNPTPAGGTPTQNRPVDDKDLFRKLIKVATDVHNDDTEE